MNLPDTDRQKTEEEKKIIEQNQMAILSPKHNEQNSDYDENKAPLKNNSRKLKNQELLEQEEEEENNKD